MVSVANCNLVAVSHQVHSESQLDKPNFWKDDVERKKSECFIFVYKGIFYQLVVDQKRV